MSPDAPRQYLVEQLGAALCSGLGKALERDFEFGNLRSFSELELESRKLPLHVAHVVYESGLSDGFVLVASISTDVMEQAALAVAEAIAETVATGIDLEPLTLLEFTDHDDAWEQLEALYGERCLVASTPNLGVDILAVLGSGLVEHVDRILLENGGQAPVVQRRDGAPQAASSIAAPTLDRGDFPADNVDPAATLGTNLPNLAGAEPPLEASLRERSIDPAASPRHAAAPAAGANGAQEGVPAEGSHLWQSLLAGVDVDVSAELGRVELSLGEVDSLGPDAVLTLDQTVDEPMFVYVNGAPFARARLVLVDDQYGIEILEILEAAEHPGALSDGLATIS